MEPSDIIAQPTGVGRYAMLLPLPERVHVQLLDDPGKPRSLRVDGSKGDIQQFLFELEDIVKAAHRKAHDGS